MAYLDSVSDKVIDALAWLGQRHWPALSRTGGVVCTGRSIDFLVIAAARHGIEFASEVSAVCRSFRDAQIQSPNWTPELAGVGLHHFVASRLLATGQKTLKLTQEYCEAFENTEVNVPFEDYRQPYETMAVELPPSYAERKLVAGQVRYPSSIVVHHDQAQRMIVIDMELHGSFYNQCVSYSDGETVENALHHQSLFVTSQDIDEQALVTEMIPVSRIALNALFAMTNGYGGEEVALTRHQQESRKALQRHKKAKDGKKAFKARLRLAVLPTYFQFQQNIKAFDEHSPPAKDVPHETSSPKKTHWRRGYWRDQRIGPGRKETRRVWIKPVLIRADRFVGNLKDTSTTYTT